MPKQLAALREFVDQGRAGPAGVLAHSIKGEAGNVGGMALSQVASVMERAGKAEDADTLRRLLSQLALGHAGLERVMKAQ